MGQVLSSQVIEEARRVEVDVAFEIAHVGRLFTDSQGNRDGVFIESLAIPRRGITMILGASGSGKSTLLNLMAGLSSPTPEAVSKQSRLLFHRRDGTGVDMLADPEGFRPGDLGFIFQDAHLLQHASAAQNAVSAASAVGRPVDPETLEEVLRGLGLAQVASRRGHALSGGQAQRVAFARAYMGWPRALLADEPTSNLDPRLAERLIHWLSGYTRQSLNPVVIVTHDYRLVAGTADQVIILGKGHSVLPEPGYLEIKNKPSNDQEREHLARQLKSLVEQAWSGAIQWDTIDWTPFADPGLIEIKRNHVQRATKPRRRLDLRDELRRFQFVLIAALTHAFRGGFGRSAVPAWLNPGGAARADTGTVLQSLRFVSGFSLRFLTLVFVLCQLLVFGTLYGGTVVTSHFEAQLTDPEVSHVLVGYKRARDVGDRDVVFTRSSLEDLEVQLQRAVDSGGRRSFLDTLGNTLNGLWQVPTEDGAVAVPKGPPRSVKVFGRRTLPYELIKILDAGGKTCGGPGPMFGGPVAVAFFKEAAYRQRPGRAPAGGKDEKVPVSNLMEVSPRNAVITERFMSKEVKAEHLGADGSLRLCVAGSPTPVTVKAVVETLPGSDQLRTEIAVHEMLFNAVHAQRGLGDLPSFTAAAVYFDYRDVETLRVALENEGVDIPDDVLDKVATLIASARDSQLVIAAVGATVVLLAFACVFLVLVSHLQSNHKALCVLRAYRFRIRHLVCLLVVEVVLAYGLAVFVSTTALHLAAPAIARAANRLFPAANAVTVEAYLGTPLILVGALSFIIAIGAVFIWWHRSRDIAVELQRA